MNGNYTYLIQKIDEFIRKYYLNKIIRGSIYLAAVLFLGYTIITLAEYYGNFNPLVRTLLFYSFITVNLYIIASYLFFPLLAYFKLGKTISHEQASAIIGQHFNPVKDKLLNTLQLRKLADETPLQRSLIEASINQKIEQLKPVPFASAIRLNENRKYLKYALVPLAVIVLIAFTAPSIFSESTERLINYNKRYVKKSPFQFIILNKKLSAIQGDDYELQVKLTGNEIPNEVYLEDGLNTFKLKKESVIRFNYTFKNLQQAKKIQLTGGGFASPVYIIDVKRKPMLLNFDVELDYPAYLNKKDETISNSGDLTVPAGTRISWKFRSQNASGINVHLNNKNIRLKPAGENSFTFSHRALKSTAYTVQPLNDEVANPDPAAYQLQVIADLHPVIDVNERTDSTNSNVLYFVGRVNDDHGLSKLNFHYRKLGSEEKNPSTNYGKAISFDKTSLQSNFFHAWDVSEVEANPGEEIEYYFEVFDNDGVNGAKATRSAIKTFKLLTEKEIAKKIEAGSKSVKQNVQQAIKQAGQLEQEAKRLNQDLLNKKNLSYDEKKQVELLLDKQRNLEELIKNIRQENKQNQNDRQEFKEQRDEILEKQKQIDDLFNNVLDEKTREILKNIEKLLEQNNKNMTQEELSKMRVDNKSLQKELDRILELYKQLEFDQKLTESIDKLKELAKEQQQLSKDSENKEKPEQLQKKQDELKEDFKDLENDLKELEQKNEELASKNDFKNPEKEQQQIKEQQQQSSNNLDKKDLKKAAENQSKAAEQMQQLSDKLQAMQQEAEEEENEVNMQNLREILDNLLTSSFDQEKVMQTLRKTNGTDPGYISQTQKQKDIKDNLKMIQDSLYSLSKKVPQIQSVVNKEIQSINSNVDKALESLAERRTAEANRNQQYAMTSINNLALMLSEALEQLRNAQKNGQAGGKGKKKQSLSQLSKMQEELNKNMQKAKQQMQQQGVQKGQQPGKGPMSEQLAKMSRQQQMIRQAMQEVNREYNKDGKGGLGNLDKLIKQMEQTETDLVNKKIQQETLIRQQDILTKMLEADKAEREREQDNQRESRQAENHTPDYNLILKEYQKQKARDTELLKTLPPSLNLFYKTKVGDYFKSLNSGNKHD